MKILVFNRELAITELREQCGYCDNSDKEIEDSPHYKFPTLGCLFNHLEGFRVYDDGCDLIEFNDYDVSRSWFVEVEVPDKVGRITDVKDLAYNQPYYYVTDRGDTWKTVAKLDFEDKERVEFRNAFFDDDSAYEDIECRKLADKMKVYIVKGSSGVWEDYFEYIERVFTDRNKAEAYCNKLNKQLHIEQKKGDCMALEEDDYRIEEYKIEE